MTAAHARDLVTGALGGYLAGSAPLGLLLTMWVRHLDIRAFGTGNVGTSNVFRNAGPGLAVVVGPLQFAQGLVPVLVALHAAGTGVAEVTAVAAVAGNCWPVWLSLRGGKGIAVATGAVAALSISLLSVLLLFYAAGWGLGRIAEGVITGFVLLPVASVFVGVRGITACCIPLLAVVLVRRGDGVATDVRGGEPWTRALRRRLVHDERPGQRLVGPRTDAG